MAKNCKKGAKKPDILFLTYLPPVAKSDFEGLISIAWIPQSVSGGLLFSLLVEFSENSPKLFENAQK